MHYHDSEDLKRLGEFKQLAPTEFSAFVEFDRIVGREGAAVPHGALAAEIVRPRRGGQGGQSQQSLVRRAWFRVRPIAESRPDLRTYVQLCIRV